MLKGPLVQRFPKSCQHKRSAGIRRGKRVLSYNLLRFSIPLLTNFRNQGPLHKSMLRTGRLSSCRKRNQISAVFGPEEMLKMEEDQIGVFLEPFSPQSPLRQPAISSMASH
jgi:hypothetical protein